MRVEDINCAESKKSLFVQSDPMRFSGLQLNSFEISKIASNQSCRRFLAALGTDGFITRTYAFPDKERV
jgi:hypothetical protein